jgi:quercetin dioxygenase-like cupin family protein
MRQQLFKKAESRFWVMHFDKAGEMLPLHNHPPERRHSTMCVQGRVFCHGEDYRWHQLLHPGEVFFFPDDEPHCVVAMDDNTILTQINLTPSLISDTAADDKYLEGFDHPNPMADLDTINKLLGQ